MKFLKTLGVTMTVCLVLGLAGIVFLLIVASGAPDLDTNAIRPDGFMTTVYDKDENVILELYGVEANRIYASLDEIPDDLENAFIAIEDSRFYQHKGIDPKGILRAMGDVLMNGRLTQGGSTITQQLIKNNVFSDFPSETTLEKISRKIQEQYLALKLEGRVDKEWILENYLNTINLGAGSWGVKAASQRYFSKPVSELSLSECSVLAGITKSPTKYNPIVNPEECRERQIQVLKAMLRLEMIDQEQYDQAMEDDVYTRIAENHSGNAINVFSYFEDALIRQIQEDLMEQQNMTAAEAWDKIYRGGLSIYSTQDSHIQGLCETAVNTEDLFTNDAEASMVVMEVETGAVRAIVGGRGKKEASLVLNRASDLVRQPGSTIKILAEYAPAMDNGSITLGTVIDDAPTSYSDGTEIHNASGEYSGRVTIRSAIARSLNTVAYRVFDSVGMTESLEYLKNFGISTLTEKDENEALALGGTYGGVTNLEMTAAYNALANDGVYNSPHYYTLVLDHDGNELLKTDVESHRVVKVETAELLTRAMQDVIDWGTGTLAQFDGVAIAGKTGTATGLRDTWMIGYSPEYTCGVWGGYDDHREQDTSAYVKYLWKYVMRRIEHDYTSAEFHDDVAYERKSICSKCGALAVYDLCDCSAEGDSIITAVFAPGTAPDSYCQCHEKVEICTGSDHRFGDYCPVWSRETRVYLKEGTYGTPDAYYVTPERYHENCEIHQYVEPEAPSEPEGGEWVTDFLDALFGGGRRNDGWEY